MVRTYSPADVNLSLALVHTVTGYVEGTGITLQKESNVFDKAKGAHGHMGRIHLPDRTYKLEITLSQTSPSNVVLNALYSVDDASRLGMFPIFLKDSSGQSVFTSPTCWIEQVPDASYGGRMNERTWTLACANTVFGIAGNDSEERILEQAGQLASIVTQFGSNLGVF